MHNYCPGRRVFLPSSCAQGLSEGERGGGGIAITQNSRKTRSSFSGEFQVVSYGFWPYT